MALAAAACATGTVADDRRLQAAAIAGACVLFAAGLWLAWANGRRIERRWRTHGIRGELELTSVSPETADRLAVAGTVRLPDRPDRPARFTAYVPTFEHRYVVEGTRVPCTVLDEDPGRVRVQLRPDQPAKSATFVERD